EKPEIMGQLVCAIRGLGEACLALDMPIVSGNVSLYNETNGEAILPTPTIGGVGLIDDYQKMCRIGTADSGDILFLVGTEATHLSCSIYQREILDDESGPAPSVDLLMEKARGQFVLAAIRGGYASACHDISDGGLAVALAEMCMASGLGAACEIDITYPHAALFGEDQARYIVAVDEEWADLFSSNSEGSGVSFARIGKVEGDRLLINDLVNISIKELKLSHEAWFPHYMANIEPTETSK
ncbi:MAG: AIR synthase-related protein, partial [Rhizobiaceae bacterium]